MKCGDGLCQVVLQVSERSLGTLTLGDRVYRELYNDREPFDFKTHVYIINQDDMRKEAVFSFTPRPKVMTAEILNYRRECRFDMSMAQLCVYEDLIREEDHTIMPPNETIEEGEVCDGLNFAHYLSIPSDGKPVHLFVMTADPAKIGFLTGTPGDGYEAGGKKIMTVQGEAEAAAAKGIDVVAATNADFFDMFGDCEPAGLCVKNGVVIANGDSMRPFFGVTAHGVPVITDFSVSPELKGKLNMAVGGQQMLLRDREICDVDPLTPFGYMRHPRTAYGIRDDGQVLALVVDGRIPEYSNGASLTDLARIMQWLGTKTAINLDGGGSSIFLIHPENEWRLLNNPADLVRPMDKLIREGYDSVLMYKK